MAGAGTFESTNAYGAKERKSLMKKILFVLLALMIAIKVCGAYGDKVKTKEHSPMNTRGWLCDFDRDTTIWLWDSASMEAHVKDTVGTCQGCCVDVTVSSETMVNGILFYKISVGRQSGWVDVEYFYWNKPGWCTN